MKTKDLMALKHTDDNISAEKIKSCLHTQFLAKHVVYFDEIESTNLYCKKCGEELEDGTLVVADIQTAGRGSRGRAWESPGGVSVYMSLVLKPDILPAYAPRLTLVMAVSIARTLRNLGMAAEIKWPNDIVLGGKKLVGILTEMSSAVNHVHHVVIGVGINVMTEHFPEEIAHRATSLFLETGRTFSRAELIAAIMEHFEEDYGKFLKTQDLSELLEQYTQLSATLGKDVHILAHENEYNARALSVDREGQLLVEKEDGTRVKVFADEVSVRGIYGYV